MSSFSFTYLYLNVEWNSKTRQYNRMYDGFHSVHIACTRLHKMKQNKLTYNQIPVLPLQFAKGSPSSSSHQHYKIRHRIEAPVACFIRLYSIEVPQLAIIPKTHCKSVAVFLWTSQCRIATSSKDFVTDTELDSSYVISKSDLMSDLNSHHHLELPHVIDNSAASRNQNNTLSKCL